MGGGLGSSAGDERLPRIEASTSIYAHVFEQDDSNSAAAINAALRVFLASAR